jgi:hypothetical protein
LPYLNSEDSLVIILGMHRSGTSVITNILSKAGFYLGEESDIMHANQWNPDGYFERWSVAIVNDIILYLAGGAWHSPPAEENIFRVKLDPKIESLLKTYEGQKQSIIKDPRMCLTLPVWENVLVDNLHIVYIDRQPEAIAASLLRRDNFSKEKSMHLWQVYTERAEKYIQNYPNFALQYEDLLSKERPNVLKNLASFLATASDLEDIAKEIVDTFMQRRKSEEAGFLDWERNDQEIGNKIPFDVLEKTDRYAIGSHLDSLLAQNDLGLISRIFDSKIAEKDEQVRHFREELNAVLSSKSWKITKPLRWILDKLT